jgi:protein-arginine deiminase
LDQNWTFVLEEIQPKLNTARQTLKDELELEDDDFIEVPVLLKMSEDNKCFFETPDSINMLVLNDWAGGTCTCLVPKPYGPVLNGEYVFERYLTGQLTPLDVTFSFVSDLPFSLHHGEIHCGTNQRHVPLLDPAWWHHKPPNIT